MSEAVDTVKGSKTKQGAGEFIGEVREELKRTSFPSSEDVRNTTIIVVVAVIFFAIYLFLVDQGWTYALQGLTWVVNQIAGI